MSMRNLVLKPFSGMPHGMMALFFIQIFSCLSYSVLYSSLVLYMRSVYGMSAGEAAAITGVFIAYNYALHLLGGYLAGRFISNRMLFCIGMAVQVVGCLLFIIQTRVFLFLGLSAFLTGCGLNVTCVNCMLTQLFKPEDQRRETAFMYTYAAMNGGFLLGYTMAGYFHMMNNYPLLFCLSALGNVIAIGFCFSSWDALQDKKTLYSELNHAQKWRRLKIGLLSIVVLFIALNVLLHLSNLANKVVLYAGVIMLIVMIVLARQQVDVQIRKKLQAFIILTLAGLVFWTLYQIAPMGLNIFIDNNVNRQILLFGMELSIPPQWFQNVNALVIMIGGPLMSMLFMRWRAQGKNIHVPGQFCAALLLIGLAFIVLPIAIHYADPTGLVSPQYIIGCYVLQSVGELLISPVGYAMIGALIPASMQGLMTGVWMMSSGVGATLSSYSSFWMTAGTSSDNPLVTNPGYAYVFGILGVCTIMVAMIVFALIPFLKEYMGIGLKSRDTETLVTAAD